MKPRTLILWVHIAVLLSVALWGLYWFLVLVDFMFVGPPGSLLLFYLSWVTLFLATTTLLISILLLVRAYRGLWLGLQAIARSPAKGEPVGEERDEEMSGR